MPKTPDAPEVTQIERFKETARALGCDEDKEKFEAALRKVATHKPPKHEAKKRSPKRRSADQ